MTGTNPNPFQTGNASIVPPLELVGAAGSVVLAGGRITGDTTDRVTLDSDRLGFGNGGNGQPVQMIYASGGGVTLNNGFLDISATGKGLQIKTGANCKMGTAILAAGTVTVANTSVTAASQIFLTDATAGGTLGTLSVGTITAGTSFVINSSNVADTSTVNYLIVEPG